YEAEPTAAFHWNVIGCGVATSLFGGDTSVGVAGVGAGARGVEVVRFGSTFVTHASPQKIDVSPLKTVSNAPTVAGKSSDIVRPATKTLPFVRTARSWRLRLF